ncbi:hypothetical protein [Chondromyces apiculatus]|uniref:Uncharacterized protein n=1 Tax=Chondromyces apiculatus DSM 436 TaxID=1192034 RepID=A0A017SV93_9BACT|nr:hypothetical protein [Chondromyces apiculatus]EYF00216.1 Hypothetical protein CAP_1058 [Chondromyces apiculatus DSM 436]
MSETALFFGLSSARLRARCRWGGGALAFTLFLPYEIIDGVPQFVWQLIPELPPAGVVASLAPTAAGLAIVIASFLTRRATSLATTVLAALTLAALLLQLGADAAAWEVLAVPESLADRSTPALLALSLTAAGVSLMFRPWARRAGRAVLTLAVASAALFYAWPTRGEAPLLTLGRALAVLPELPSFGLQLGMLFIVLVALWPLLIPLAGLHTLRRPPTREQPVLAAFALYGLPGILLMFAYRGFMGAQAGAALWAALLTIVILTALLCLVASAVEVLGEAWVTPEAALEQPQGLPLRRALAAALAAVTLLGAAQWVLSRPPSKGVTWTLQQPTADGDKLFGELLHAWGQARLRWDRRVRTQSAAGGLVAVKAAARELTTAAHRLDPGLGQAIAALTAEAGDLDLAGRRWYRLIGEVNEANRRAGLPYYVDPTVSIYQTEEGLRRHFSVHSYRIEKVRRFLVGRKELATLQVRQIGTRRGDHTRLGFSRDLQPFALVVLDELTPHRDEVAALATASRCTAAPKLDQATPAPDPAASTAPASADPAPPASADPAAPDTAAPAAPPAALPTLVPETDEALARCGELLAGAVKDAGGQDQLLAALTEATERHELQHQVDGPHLPLASLVLKRLAAYAKESQDRVNRELSAYLAEMTAPGAAPRLGLVHLARFILLTPRGTEHHVGTLALEALTGQEVPREGNKVDRAAVARALTELGRESDDALRARAAQAWSSLFGVPLVPPQPVP